MKEDPEKSRRITREDEEEEDKEEEIMREIKQRNQRVRSWCRRSWCRRSLFGDWVEEQASGKRGGMFGIEWLMHNGPK